MQFFFVPFEFLGHVSSDHLYGWVWKGDDSNVERSAVRATNCREHKTRRLACSGLMVVR